MKIKSFLQKINPKAKQILSILGIAVVISQGAFAFSKLAATEPRFNFLSGDRELLRGSNLTTGQSVWRDPISGDAGNEFQGIVYYHNGVVDTTAQNTRIRVSIPEKTTNNTAKISATISADNAATVSDTVVDGQTVGLSGLTVNLNQNADLEFVPGSVRWYPDQLENPNVPVSLPNGQSGNEITGAGINIGDIKGCWPFAGYVVFNFRTKTIEQPNLDINKTVRNVTANQSSFVEIADASANDKVEFKIEVKNPGTTTLSSVVVKDNLPASLSYVDGSLKIDGNAVAAGDFFANGLNIGSIASGSSKTILFEAKVPANISNVSTLTNTATATSGTLSDTDQAQVRLIADQTVNIVENKDAKNLTTGETATLSNDIKRVEARAGDRIEYTLTTKNTGNATAPDYVIKDGIADVLQESNFESATDGGSVVNTSLSGDNSKQIVYPAVNIGAGEAVVRKFIVKIMDPLPNNPASGNDFDHNLYNIYGDRVLVRINIPTPPPQSPILHIAKTVRNVTTNETDFVENNSARAGETLEYMIAFSNTGNAPADQVRFKDVLPANVKYIAGTTVISTNGGTEHTLADNIAADGIMLDTIAAGENGYIKIRALIESGAAVGSSLVNTASIIDNDATISDTATTCIVAEAIKAAIPQLPRTGADTLIISGIVAVVAAAGFAIKRFI